MNGRLMAVLSICMAIAIIVLVFLVLPVTRLPESRWRPDALTFVFGAFCGALTFGLADGSLTGNPMTTKADRRREAQ